MAYTEDQIKQLMANELGFEENLDFTSTTDEAVLKINATYDVILNSALQAYKFSWSMPTVKLDFPVETTDSKYTYKYSLPCDFLRYITSYSDKYRNSPIIDYEMYCDELYCNQATEIYLTYVQVAEPSTFPDYFVSYLRLKGAATLCFDITGDVKLLEILEAKSDREWILARNIDGVQKRSRQIRSQPYIQVRG
jgi:hypothetical protein